MSLTITSIFYPPQPLIKHIFFIGFLLGLIVLGLLPEQILEQGELRTYQNKSYRWFSAHFIHLNFQHTLMNVAGAFVVWLLCAFLLPNALLLVLMIILPLCVSASLVFLSAEPLHYRGFSGVLEGFLIAGIIWQWWLSRTFAIILGSFVVVKIIIEQMPGFNEAYLMGAIGGFVAVDAHLYGFIFGLTGAFIYLLLAFLKVPFCVAPWQASWSKN